MFHVMLVLPALIIAFFVIAIAALAIVTLVASAVGGASVAVFIKSKTAKRLLFVGISIFAFIAGAILLPFILVYFKLSADIFLPAIIAVFVCIAILSFLGIRFSNAVNTKAGKTALKVVFSIVLFIAVVLAISMPIIKNVLLP